MEAMSYTWAINDNEYNFGMRPMLLNCINLLEESAQLEPNAAYTYQQLGILYNHVYEYEKANTAFQKYLDLQPNNDFSKLQLGIIYNQLKEYDKAIKQFEPLIPKYPGYIPLKEYLIQAYQGNNETKKVAALIDQLLEADSTKYEGYFQKGLIFSKEINLDSAKHYYELSRKYCPGYCSVCDNNIGQIYFVTGHTDSASKYFQKVLAQDSTSPFPHFNLGTIDQKEGDLHNAMKEFYSTVLYSQASLQGFITNLQLYFGKTFDTTDKAAYTKFTKQTFMFNMQYVSFLSMLYTYIRVPGHIDSTKNIDYLFNELYNYKTHNDLTWFHNACYKALRKDTTGTLESLEKALKLGFGNYFMLTCDNDLSILRDLPEFKALVQKYFPDQFISGKK